MQTTRRTHLLLLDHAGFPELAVQRGACPTQQDSAAVEHLLTANNPRTWQDSILDFLNTLQEGDLVLAESLSALAPTLSDLLDNLGTLTRRGASFTSHPEGFDSRVNAELLSHVEAIRTAHQTAQDRQAAAELAAPTPPLGVTPPHARAIPLGSFERVIR